MKARWLKIVRWSGTIVLVAWLLSLIDVKETIRIISATRLDLLLAVIVTIFALRIFMAWRWLYVLRALEVRARFMDALRITMVSITLHLVMPGGSATVDAYRTWSMSRLQGDVSRITASVAADRLFGLYSLALMAFLAVQISTTLPGNIDWHTIITWIFLVSTVGVILIVVSGSMILAWCSPLFSWWPSLQRGVARTAMLLKELDVLRTVAIPSTMLSLPVQILRGIEFFLIYKAIGVDIELMAMLVYTPIVFVLMILPISIAGVGLREGAFYLMLSPHGVSVDAVVAAGFLFQLSGIAMGLPGAFWISKGATIRKDAVVREGANSSDPPA